MQQFLTVFEFEFLGFIKSKKNWIPTIIISVLSLILAILPFAINFFSNAFEGNETDRTGIFFEVETIGKYEEEFQKEFSQDDYVFVDSYDSLMEGLNKQDFDTAYYFSNEGLIIYQDSLSITTMDSSDKFVNKISDIMTEKLLENSNSLAEYESYDEYLSNYKNEEYSIVNGEISFEENDTSDLFLRVFSVYFFIILIYVLISQYASYVTISISNEKTSKTMESLIASTSTNSLIFGKVVAVFCGSVVQVLLIMAVMFLCSNIGLSNLDSLGESASSLQDIEGIYLGINQIFDPSMITYFLFLAMAGFLMYLFIFATLASTISKVEDISSSVQLGTVIFMLAFFDAIGIILNPTNKVLVSLAYFPLFTPLSMMAKYASGIASTFDIVYSIIISIASVVLLGFFAGRCYKVGVLYYGSKPTIKKLVSMFIFNK